MSEYRGTNSRKRNAVKAFVEDPRWDCSVCTFSNSPEAFKCSMCDVRKGTSTRKPKLNQHIVAQQEATRLVAQAPVHSPASVRNETSRLEQNSLNNTEESKSIICNLKPISATKTGEQTEKLKVSRSKSKQNTDRPIPISTEVTVNNVTVVFTELKARK